MAGYVEKELTGWGRYPRGSARVYRPEKVSSAIALASAADSLRLAHGLGRSYGDAALNSGHDVILTRGLGRFLDFDAETGALTCEAGVGLRDILEVFLPRGWFPPVTPGTQFASVGGAVAADVHGKNHHREGAFSNHLDWIDLAIADGSVLRCSPSMDPDLFWTTAGGMGLTGLILGVCIRLKRVESGFIRVDRHRSPTLEETMRLLEREDRDYLYSVAWIDCLASGRSLGRSVLLRGNHCGLDELDAARRQRPFQLAPPGKLSLPFDLPGFILNPLTIRLMNTLYYRRFPKGRSTRVENYAPFFYPLDAVGAWNRAYGRRGFLQYQCVFPPDSSAAGLEELLARISSGGDGSFLAVLKRFGPESGPLSFPMPGFTLALDFPMRGSATLEFLEELDRIVLKHGGRVYLAKDARLSPESFRRMYPRYPEWLSVKRRVDPTGRFSSDLSRRLKIDEDLR